MKWVGPKAVAAIEKERKLFGNFVDLEDFIKRIFRGKFEKVVVDGTEEVENVRNQVNTRHVKNLIIAGAFDDLEGIDDICQRHTLLIKATDMLGFYLNEKDFPADLLDKQYFWARKQVEISGFGAVDYKGLLTVQGCRNPQRRAIISSSSRSWRMFSAHIRSALSVRLSRRLRRSTTMTKALGRESAMRR